MTEVLVLIGVGILAGAINAIAGGGAILILPVLLWLGLHPVYAVATIGLAVMPGLLGSIAGYRRELTHLPKEFLWFIVPTIAGSLAGAIGLYKIDAGLFADIIPWLVLSAVFLLIMQTKIHHAIVKDRHKISTDKELGTLLLGSVALVLAVYGGFFGVGVGLLIMALFGLSSRLKNTFQLNALKNLYVLVIDITAFMVFVSVGFINFKYGLLVAVGTGIGGFFAAKYSKHVSSHAVHNLAVLLGSMIALYLFIK